MRKVRIKRPPAAMVVAVAALSLSLVGTGVAATISLSKGEKKQVRKIANKRITARAGTLSVAKADDALKLGGIDASTYQAASNSMEDGTDNPLTLARETIGSPVQITTTGTKRVIAMGTVTAGAADADAFVCRLSIDGTAGLEYTQFIPATVSPAESGSVSPVVSAVVPAGVHTVTLECRSLRGGNTAVQDSALAAWAVSA